MKKADIDKLVEDPDHEIRIQAPNSSYPVGFGQVVATGKHQRKPSSYVPMRGDQPILDATGGESPGAHIRYTESRFGREVTVDKVVPYSHIHAETRDEYRVRKDQEDEAARQRRKQQEQARDANQQRADDIASRFKEFGVTIRYRHDSGVNHPGNMTLSVDDAEHIIGTLESR